jgi:hypothetical protein
MGVGYGINCIATPRMMEEYLAPHLWSFLSPIFILSLAIGAVFATSAGLLYPPDDSPPEVLRESDVWYYLFAFPIIPYLLSICMLLGCIKTESPKYYLMQE